MVEVEASPEEWVTRHDVAVYDSHIIVDRETGNEFPVTEAKLQEFADKMNLRAELTGDETPIVIGHTKDGLPETQQPPIVGYGTDFYVARHPKKNLPVLYARNYKVYKSNKIDGEEMTGEEVLRRFPRRSPEVWIKDGIIDPISILGATTPMRDLGLVRNAKGEVDTEPMRYGFDESKHKRGGKGTHQGGQFVKSGGQSTPTGDKAGVASPGLQRKPEPNDKGAGAADRAQWNDFKKQNHVAEERHVEFDRTADRLNAIHERDLKRDAEDKQKSSDDSYKSFVGWALDNGQGGEKKASSKSIVRGIIDKAKELMHPFGTALAALSLAIGSEEFDDAVERIKEKVEPWLEHLPHIADVLSEHGPELAHQASHGLDTVMAAVTPFLAQFSRNGQKLRYGKGQAMDISAIIMALEALLQQLKTGMTPVGDQAEGPMEQNADLDLSQTPGQQPGAEPPDQDPGDVTDLTDGAADESGEDDDPMKYQAGQDSAPSSTNGFLPGDDDMSVQNSKKKTGAVCSDPVLDRVKMQKDQDQVQSKVVQTRLEAEVKALKDQMQRDRLRYQREVRTADLNALVQEGYALDVNEEIEDLATLSDEQYEKRMGTIRKRYSRIPVGESFIQTAALKEGVNVKNDRAVSSKAAEIASKMGKDFGEVLRQLQNGEI